MITINELAVATEKIKYQFSSGIKKRNSYYKAAIKKNEQRILKIMRKMVK